METESGSFSFFSGELNKLERFFSHVSVYRDVAHVYRCFRGLLRVDNAYGVDEFSYYYSQTVYIFVLLAAIVKFNDMRPHATHVQVCCTFAHHVAYTYALAQQ